MMGDMISMFIDDELDLGQKVQFVEKVHDERGYKDQTVELLKQEMLIRSDVVKSTPPLRHRIKRRAFWPVLWPKTLFASAAAVSAVIIFALLLYAPKTDYILHRFVIYRPDAKQAEIMGTFTRWKPVPMKKAGDEGYWETTLRIPAGEHRFSYLLDQKKRIIDPTVLIHEQDDFGGENSILFVEGKA